MFEDDLFLIPSIFKKCTLVPDFIFQNTEIVVFRGWVGFISISIYQKSDFMKARTCHKYSPHSPLYCLQSLLCSSWDSLAADNDSIVHEKKFEGASSERFKIWYRWVDMYQRPHKIQRLSQQALYLEAFWGVWEFLYKRNDKAAVLSRRIVTNESHGDARGVSALWALKDPLGGGFELEEAALLVLFIFWLLGTLESRMMQILARASCYHGLPYFLN